ncbi:MAG: carboxylesterase/lipase family protein [Nostoc sp. ChiQUE02]|uniref:carboxylesterase/lipase family protein n=1 Tax=Nostoc sp. ChiQUE02 TaxID=3075377 RepID=UPI002AD3EFC2|nr:carboxylesterase family protein [Nostoc sp. ChiQUE02]MDZ8234075.1 carboxylesterase family protein [Nostoc sp. ChiQUE02]
MILLKQLNKYIVIVAMIVITHFWHYQNLELYEDNIFLISQTVSMNEEKNGQLFRRSEPLTIENQVFEFKSVSESTLQSFKKGILHNYLIKQNTVNIDTGTIEGTISDDILSFKGIPYAAPPVGNLRWRSPQPVKSWKGVRKAIAYGNDCIHKPFPVYASMNGGKTSEDCLVLNVWRPVGNPSSKKLPVLIWIHGGGFLDDSSASAIFDGSAFAQQGLVVVSFNYRLGRLGFFAHPALTAAKEGRLGNYALLDQLAALRWVQRNIAAFAGDPNQVTIMGESAGGISVIHHLISPEARGLFQRAIVLSGGGRTYLVGERKLSESTPEQPAAEQSGIEFAKSVGITGTGAVALKALRALPAEVVNGDMNMVTFLAEPPTYAGGIIFDGSIVTATPEEILRRGEAAKVPLLIGSTSQELPITYPPSRENPLSYFGVDADKARVLYNLRGKLQPSEILQTIAIDMTMHEPARFVAKQMVAAGNPVWLYRFGYVAESLRPKVKDADHGSEQPYLFMTLDACYGKDVTEKDRTMAQMFHTYFANFAKFGNPNGSGLPNWSTYDPGKFDLMRFTPNGGSVMAADPWKERLDLVERAVERHNAARDLSCTDCNN